MELVLKTELSEARAIAVSMVVVALPLGGGKCRFEVSRQRDASSDSREASTEGWTQSGIRSPDFISAGHFVR